MRASCVSVRALLRLRGSFPRAAATFGRFMDDIRKSLPVILVCGGGLAFILGLVFLVLMKWCAGLMVRGMPGPAVPLGCAALHLGAPPPHLCGVLGVGGGSSRIDGGIASFSVAPVPFTLPLHCSASTHTDAVPGRAVPFPLARPGCPSSAAAAQLTSCVRRPTRGIVCLGVADNPVVPFRHDRRDTDRVLQGRHLDAGPNRLGGAWVGWGGVRRPPTPG
jgi:hypothetical protein